MQQKKIHTNTVALSLEIANNQHDTDIHNRNT